jgi:hypothetical protein
LTKKRHHRVFAAPKAVVFIAEVLILCSCSLKTNAEPQPTVPQELIKLSNSPEASTRYTAWYLLAEMKLNQSQLDTLEKGCAKLTESLSQLFCQYSLARRLQSEDNTAKFVSLFPTDARTLSALLTETTQDVFPKGLFVLLADAARYNDKALIKLVQASQSADTVAATLLNDLLDDVRNHNPERYAKIIKQEGK